MQPSRPSPFFRRTQFEQGHPELHSRLAARRRARRLLAILSMLACLALAVGASLYLSTPHEPLEWRALWAHPKPPMVKTSPVTDEPGAVGLQVQRGKRSHVYRFRQAEDSWSVEDVTSAGKQRPQKASYSPLPAPEKPATVAP